MIEFIDLLFYGILLVGGSWIFFKHPAQAAYFMVSLLTIAVSCVLWYVLEDSIFVTWLWVNGSRAKTSYLCEDGLMCSRMTGFANSSWIWLTVIVGIVVSKCLVGVLFYKLWKTNAYQLQERGISTMVIIALVALMIANIQMFEFGGTVRYGPIKMWSP